MTSSLFSPSFSLLVPLPSRSDATLVPYVDKYKASIEEMCADVYGGFDFVPSMLSTYKSQPQCHPLVAVASDVAVAFVNVRERPDNSWYIEGVRVSRMSRGTGIGGAVLRAVLSIRPSGCVAQSVTEPGNGAMKHIFFRGGWEIVCTGRVWPSVMTMWPHHQVSAPASTTLPALGITPDLFSPATMKLVTQWQRLGPTDVTAVLNLVGGGACPFWFAFDLEQKASQFLDVQGEGRSAWALPNGRGLILVREETHAEPMPDCVDRMVSARVTDIAAAESVIQHVVQTIGFGSFFIAFDDALPADSFKESAVLKKGYYNEFSLYQCE